MIDTRLCRRFILPALAGVLALFAADRASGDHRSLLPPDDLVIVEVPRGSELLDHPLATRLLAGLEKSSQWQGLKSTPQFDRLRLIRRLIEKASGEDWKTGLRKLTAGGAAVAFSPGKTGGVTAVIAAADAKALQRFIAVAQRHVRSRLPEPQRSGVYRTVRKAGREYTKVGEAAFALVGNRLLFGSNERRLLDALKRLDLVKREERPQRGAKADRPPAPYLRVSVNAAGLRKLPDVAKLLKLPAREAGAVALLGGWTDLLRNGNRLAAELVPDGNSLELRVRSAATRAATTPGLTGFFTDGKRETIAPLLQLPNTIYAASWYRDYRSLWNGRSKLLTAKSLKTIEEGDETIRKQFSVIGGKMLPSRAFSLMGPRFRAVAVRQPKSEYRVDQPSRLPAGGLAIELRDESAFRDEVVPFFRGLSLILTFGEQKMLLYKSKYKGADLAGLRFRDDAASASQADHIRYNFAPTYAVTRGHFFAGSSATIVRQMIDEIDRQSRERAAVRTTATEMQRLSLTEAAQAVRDFGSTLTLALSFNGGLSVAESKRELELLAKLLATVGEITTEAGFDKRGFLYRVRIGKN
ncbi:MAG: hypothetical protein ACE5KM_16030 [Planctomycetaceae bacterium]